VRRVACFAASSAIDDREVPEPELEKLIEVVASWLRTKGCPALPTDRMSFTMTGGRSAEATRSDWSAKVGRLTELTLDEVTEAGRFYTRICLGVWDTRLHLFVELRAGSSDYQIAPVSVDVRAPQVLRDLFARRTWTVGTTPVVVKAIEWFGTKSALKFMALIRHEQRNLPIVAVSRNGGELLTPALAGDLARELCGLALVVSLDEAASWETTRQLGKQLSCYNGAVRLYWPIRGARKALDHPLWTRQRLLANATSASSAGARIRSQIRRRLLSLSTFAVDDPPELTRLKEEAAREAFERMRREAEQRGDQSAVAEQYFNEAARLEGLVSQKTEEIEHLKAQVESLLEAMRYTPEAPIYEIPPDSLPDPTTVEEAVDLAGRRFADDLLIGANVADGISTLSPDAGPPDKIFQYLETLAEMTRLRRDKGLGKDVIQWLKEQGLKASGESESVLASAEEMQKRTWDAGGVSRGFEKHLKPTDGTSPDRCVRIYFDYDDARKKTVVGYVGRHL